MPKANASPSPTVFGRRMRAAREAIGLPQDKLGVMVGLDESSSSARMSRYETGVHEPPIPVAMRIAESLDVPLAYLYCLDDGMAEMILAYGKMGSIQRAQLRTWVDRTSEEFMSSTQS